MLEQHLSALDTLLGEAAAEPWIRVANEGRSIQIVSVGSRKLIAHVPTDGPNAHLIELFGSIMGAVGDLLEIADTLYERRGDAALSSPEEWDALGHTLGTIADRLKDSGVVA